MTAEMKGQLPLFTVEGCEQEIQDEHADETCPPDCCGCHLDEPCCTSDDDDNPA